MMVLLRSGANGMENGRTATYRIWCFVSTIGDSLRPEVAWARAPRGDYMPSLRSHCAIRGCTFVTFLFPSSDYGAAVVPRYCSALTCSIHSTTVPLSFSAMAIWVMTLSGAAPCQCFTPAGIQTTSPCRISSIGPPHRCTRPVPAVTIRVWPSGWVCQAVRERPASQRQSLPLFLRATR